MIIMVNYRINIAVLYCATDKPHITAYLIKQALLRRSSSAPWLVPVAIAGSDTTDYFGTCVICLPSRLLPDPVPCLGPRSTRSCGGGGADLGRSRKGVGKMSIRIKTFKRAIPGYATDVFVMLELKTITIRDPASQCSVKCVESVCQFTAQLLSTEVAWPIICNLDTCRFVTIGFEKKAPIFLPLCSQQGTGDWLCGGEG